MRMCVCVCVCVCVRVCVCVCVSTQIRRILKPGGKFLFWEHVLSETDEAVIRNTLVTR